MKVEKIIKLFIKIALILAVLAIFVFLFSRDLVWSGKLEIQTDFLKFTPYFSILKPQARIIMADNNEVIGEPIWFDVSLPRDFTKATVQLEYKDDYNYEKKIGPNTGADWDYKILENLQTGENGYKISSVAFDMNGKNINNNKLRFSISIPGLIAEKPIYIKNVKVILERQPLFEQGLYQNLSEYFNYVRSQYKN